MDPKELGGSRKKGGEEGAAGRRVRATRDSEATGLEEEAGG